MQTDFLSTYMKYLLSFKIGGIYAPSVLQSNFQKVKKFRGLPIYPTHVFMYYRGYYCVKQIRKSQSKLTFWVLI